MDEIKCPNCGKVFQVDKAGYAAIVAQVRDEQFTAELADRQSAFERDKSQAVELARSEAATALAEATSERDQRIASLEAQLESTVAEQKATADAAVKEQQLAVEAAAAKAREEANRAVADAEKARDAAIAELERVRETEAAKTATLESEHALEIEKLQSENSIIVRQKDEQISQLRDFKTRLSTKMIGETLEQHCESEFNSIRTFNPTAQFYKDNETVGGTKGDYIYREFAEDGTELLSIMFEMKNDDDKTQRRHKNAHFFAKLDEDRRKKGCEYAVLVSLLEPESELYNAGIVDVSYEYPKMYVVRPQLFTTIIGILRNAARDTHSYRREMEAMRQANIDVTNFEAKMQEFQESFSRNCGLANDRFQDAIKSIDKTIDDLNKVKEALVKSERHLAAANNKAQGLTIRRLTNGNETMKALFEEAAAKRDAEPETDEDGAELVEASVLEDE